MAISTMVFFSITVLAFLPHVSATYNVLSFGATGDGRTDSTNAFLRAWMVACSSASPANVYVPRGSFMIRSVAFNGPCRSRIEFRIDGSHVALGNYNAPGNSGFWILFYKVSKLSLYGGILDARAYGYWDCRKRRQNCPVGTRSISLMWCNNVLVSCLTSLNSESIHIGIGHSSNVKMQNLKITVPRGSPNTDGIHVQYSMRVTITGAAIWTGDDCISIGPGSMNLFISKIGCGPRHGISIGSLGNSYNEPRVQNVTVTDSVFTKTDNGVRVKSWARPSVGYARHLLFKNLIMRNVTYPIIIDQTYCPDNSCPLRNIKGTSATQEALKFDCSATNPCRGITLQDIKLTYLNRFYRPIVAYCSNARGTYSGSVFPKSCV